MAEKKVELKITSAIVIGGEIKPKDSVVTVPEGLAKNLMARGRAELSTAIEDNLEGKTLSELKDIVKASGLGDPENMKKAELIDAIEAAQSE